jgi:hypothetical protein
MLLASGRARTKPAAARLPSVGRPDARQGLVQVAKLLITILVYNAAGCSVNCWMDGKPGGGGDWPRIQGKAPQAPLHA